MWVNSRASLLREKGVSNRATKRRCSAQGCSCKRSFHLRRKNPTVAIMRSLLLTVFAILVTTTASKCIFFLFRTPDYLKIYSFCSILAQFLQCRRQVDCCYKPVSLNIINFIAIFSRTVIRDFPRVIR